MPRALVIKCLIMKVILLKNITNIGQKNEIKNVSDGYATNYLIPQKLAKAATPVELEKLKHKEFKKEKTVANRLASQKMLINKLDGIKLELKAKASDSGKLFAGVTVDMIAAELKNKTKIDLDKRYIKLDKPIKDIGEHNVSVEFRDGQSASLHINIISE